MNRFRKCSFYGPSNLDRMLAFLNPTKERLEPMVKTLQGVPLHHNGSMGKLRFVTPPLGQMGILVEARKADLFGPIGRDSFFQGTVEDLSSDREVVPQGPRLPLRWIQRDGHGRQHAPMIQYLLVLCQGGKNIKLAKKR